MGTSLQHLLLIVCIFFSFAVDFIHSCAKIHPDSPISIPVELGKEFTATCRLNKDSKYTADDIEWLFADIPVPREFYKKINESAVAVTVNVSADMRNPLKCKAFKQTQSYEPPCMYGIFLSMGYPPLKPQNLTCVAVQDRGLMSPNLICSWDPGTRHPIISTTYCLIARDALDSNYSNCSNKTDNTLSVNLGTFPHYTTMHVKVEVKNALGTESLELLDEDAERFAKPNPPSNLRIIPENNFPTSLMVNWTHPIHKTVFYVRYHIRYCKAGFSSWTEVPQDATKAYAESFRLQFLEPDTEYVVQMRCIERNNISHWSDWSSNVTARTPEAIPERGPDLWRVYGDDDTVVKLIWKEPVKANGKILGYNLFIEENGFTQRLVVHSNEYQFNLKGKNAFIKMTANNSAGVSPQTTLAISKPSLNPYSGVDDVSWSVRGGKMCVEWLPPKKPGRNVHEFLVEWVSVPDNNRNWQRVSGNTSTVLEGNLEPFIRYNISVYPMYPISRERIIYHWPGRSIGAVEAYLQEGPPLEGPSVVVTNTQKNSVSLEWDDIPIPSQQGFLTNYTIFYKTGDDEQFIVVDSSVLSYKLTGLASESQYVVHIMASNAEGSVNGSDSSLYTKKYEDGEIEVIVVLVCLGFLFFIVFIMMLSIKNKEIIKKRLWPKVPDPHHSTLANWSPDCPTRTDTPKEAMQPDVSVVEVDVFDGKSLCEEDKTMLPLKKDKYFSEENNSSGIGGSSCMSSPRQSVSDSDEGDSGQTTASTVQYSSVVASGYKGQTPSLQAPNFIRSESTQPLLDCEEQPESLLESSSPPRNSYFRRGAGLEQMQPQEAEETGCFSPMEEEEDTPTLTEDPPGPAPGYMPQQNGYRPQ